MEDLTVWPLVFVLIVEMFRPPPHPVLEMVLTFHSLAQLEHLTKLTVEPVEFVTRHFFVILMVLALVMLEVPTVKLTVPASAVLSHTLSRLAPPWMEVKLEAKLTASKLVDFASPLAQQMLDVLEPKGLTVWLTDSASLVEQVLTASQLVIPGVEMVVKYLDKFSVIPPLVSAQHPSNVPLILHVLVVVVPIVKLTEHVWTAL